MMGEVEAEEAGGFADVMSLYQQTFCLIDDVVVDISDGRAACCLVDDVAEIAGRIGQFGGTSGDGWQALGQLSILAEIGFQKVVKALQQVGFSPILFRQLALIDAVAVLEYQVQISQ